VGSRPPRPGGPHRVERVSVGSATSTAARGSSVGPASLRLGLGYGFALAAAASFGIGGVIAKSTFNSLAPSVLAEFRVFLAFLIFLALFGIFRRDELRVRREDIPIFAVFGIVGLAGVSLVYYEAIKRIPIGVALVIEYTGPLLLLAYARLRGRTVGGRLWIAAALAIVGCFFAAGAYDAGLRELNGLGLALAAADAFFFALYFALAERLGARYTTTTPADVYVQIAEVVVIATLIPFALTLAAVRLIPAARVGLTATFEPVVAAVAAWVVLSERLELQQIVGGVVVLAAIAIAQSLRPTAGSV